MNPEQQKANEDWAANRQTVKGQIDEWQAKIWKKKQTVERLRAAGDDEDAEMAEYELHDLEAELACLYEEELILGDKPPY